MKALLCVLLVVVVGLVVCYAFGIIPMMSSLFASLLDFGTELEGFSGIAQVLAHA